MNAGRVAGARRSGGDSWPGRLPRPLKSVRDKRSGDWGDVCEEDARENDRSLKEDFRLFLVYHDTQGTRFYVVTKTDRSATTVLLPEDY